MKYNKKNINIIVLFIFANNFKFFNTPYNLYSIIKLEL